METWPAEFLEPLVERSGRLPEPFSRSLVCPLPERGTAAPLHRRPILLLSVAGIASGRHAERQCGARACGGVLQKGREASVYFQSGTVGPAMDLVGPEVVAVVAVDWSKCNDHMLLPNGCEASQAAGGGSAVRRIGDGLSPIGLVGPLARLRRAGGEMADASSRLARSVEAMLKPRCGLGAALAFTSHASQRHGCRSPRRNAGGDLGRFVPCTPGGGGCAGCEVVGVLREMPCGTMWSARCCEGRLGIRRSSPSSGLGAHGEVNAAAHARSAEEAAKLALSPRAQDRMRDETRPFAEGLPGRRGRRRVPRPKVCPHTFLGPGACLFYGVFPPPDNCCRGHSFAKIWAPDNRTIQRCEAWFTRVEFAMQCPGRGTGHWLSTLGTVFDPFVNTFSRAKGSTRKHTLASCFERVLGPQGKHLKRM